MSDQELCRQIAKLWVDNGRDSKHIYWYFHEILSTVEDYEEGILIFKGENNEQQ